MKVTKFFISRTRRIFTKLLDISESSIKIKFISNGAIPVILLTSAVISRQRLLYGNEVAQYLQNCKYYNIGQDHFRKLL